MMEYGSHRKDFRRGYHLSVLGLMTGLGNGAIHGSDI
jgi:hypothetical protein